ncbi:MULTISPECIES: DUF885 domain-containing protein [unclassified Duganella]|uniref:DUF885 domain-containing protein n=1 Tax=unclassified Duganella TaxID=2636909 RepID=UPI000E34AE26|nr:MULTISPECIES: DUF885 domain-containing protein [unclassified Duganella]RFP12967.1 DUF885 domain-containing protein [Duganella sp. BJB475]RFP28976.1 DUF885 domain-containing protein [Duganella sp. BJB476]
MIKTNIALAVLMTTLAVAPAGATTHHKTTHTSAKSGGKSAHTSHATHAKSGGKSTKSGKSSSKGSSKSTGKHGKAKAVAATAAVAAVAAPSLKPSGTPERRQDRSFDGQSSQFLNALWRIDSESAIYAGKYDTAATLSIPDKAGQAKELAFIDEWKQRFGAINASQLSAKQRTDLALLINKLDSDRFRLTTLKEYEWNPASYNVAGPIDLILNTEYAAQPQRLRTLLKRIAGIPAYYEAARANIVNPTREHTRLAIAQAPGVQTLLTEVDKAAQASILTPVEKQLYTQRVNAALTAVDGYVAFLTEMDKQMDTSGRRTFRLGKELYEQKFAFDIQSGSTAEQTYQKALAAREELLANMERISDELWDKTMGSTAKPADRFAKIGKVIDKLSERHVKREDFFAEIRRQVPVLQDWVISHNLLTLDPKKQLEVRATPAYQAGVAGASIDAPGPYRPQDRTYYNVTPLDGATPEAAESSLREYNYWILQILNIHEAIPGHYAQLVYANKSPSIVKSIFGNGAMVEGWAVYGERMMLESGYGDNAPEMWLMYSKWNLRSVTNTILDYSVHVLGMTEEQAIDLLTRQAFQTRSEAVEKWHRVQVSSVQLTSYFSGYSEIMELREQRKQQLGAKFNLKEFHEQFLSYGSAPVRVIKGLMTQ